MFYQSNDLFYIVTHDKYYLNCNYNEVIAVSDLIVIKTILKIVNYLSNTKL